MLPTLVFLPRGFYGQRSLSGYSPWGCKESDTTEHHCMLREPIYLLCIGYLFTTDDIIFII